MYLRQSSELASTRRHEKPVPMHGCLMYQAMLRHVNGHDMTQTDSCHGNRYSAARLADAVEQCQVNAQRQDLSARS
jgi:hypothetical protein